MLDGEKRIKKMERSIGRQVIGRTWINVIEKDRKEMSRKEFNNIVIRTIRFNRSEADQILDVLRRDGKVRVTQRRIRLL